MSELLGKTGRRLNTVSFFRSFVLNVCISRYGTLTLKAAGGCAHWIGSGAKGEQVQSKGGEGKGGEGRTQVFMVDLEEEKEADVHIKPGVSEG